MQISKKCLIIIYLTVVNFANAQKKIIYPLDSAHWKAQQWGSTCWAAAATNTLNKITNYDAPLECMVVDSMYKFRDTPYWNTMCSAPTECNNFGDDGLRVETKAEYIGTLKKFGSFSFVQYGYSHALRWRDIYYFLNRKTQPMIFSYDFDYSSNNHVVNVIGYYFLKNIDTNHQKWLYVFDPKPNCRGTFYLKNYQTYQLPSVLGADDEPLQTTYFNFSIPKRPSTKTKAVLFRGKRSNPNVYADSSNFGRWFQDFWKSIELTDTDLQKVTGLTKSAVNGSDIYLGSAVAVNRIENRDGIQPQQMGTIMTESTSIQKVIPIFRCTKGDTTPQFISAVIIRPQLSDSTKIIIDRIQAYSVSEELFKEVHLTCPADDNRTDRKEIINLENRVVINVPINFIETKEGFQFFEYKEKIYDVNADILGGGVSKVLFYKKVGNVSNVSKTVIIDKTTASNPAAFSDILRNKGFEIDASNKVKINDKVVNVSDLQKQVQESYKSKNIKEVILIQKK
jgi:hypothetical protein